MRTHYSGEWSDLKIKVSFGMGASARIPWIVFVATEMQGKIENTLKYTQLVHFGDDEFASRTAKNSEEARKLLEAGFEYVCTTPEEIMLFRKRK